MKVSGLAFPASQIVASDPNTLDDYERGNYTPTDVSGAGLSLSGWQGKYVKVGGVAFVWVGGNFPITSNTSPVYISLPFAPSRQSVGACHSTSLAAENCQAEVSYARFNIQSVNQGGIGLYADVSGAGFSATFIYPTA